MTSFGLVFCTLITITRAGEQFVASPTILEIGLTKKLQIECMANTDDTLALTTQIRILFSNNKEKPVYRLLGLVDSVFGIENTSGAVDSGEIVGKGTSKLKLTWDYPKQDRVGVYRCDVMGKRINGVQKSKSFTVEVSANPPDQVTISGYIHKISSDLEKLKEFSTKEEMLYSELKDRFDKGKSKFFRVSNVFQGRRYYLSVNTNVQVTGDAEVMCELFGGYLVEIDSAEEYQFIVTFLGNFTQYQLVLTGGRDEVLENNWINTYSQSAVQYINWGAGQPDNGRGGNCLYLYSGFGWRMADHTCYKGVTDYVAGYLCEIKE